MNLRAARASDYATFVKLFAELDVDHPVPHSPTWERDIMPTMLVAEENHGRSVMSFINCSKTRRTCVIS